jgi:hypothetical protein
MNYSSNVLSVFALVVVLIMAHAPARAQETPEESAFMVSDMKWESSDSNEGSFSIDFEKSIRLCHARRTGFREGSFLELSGRFGSRGFLGEDDEEEPVGPPVVEKLEESGELTPEQIAELMANPLSYLWFGQIQNETSWWDGDLLDLVNKNERRMNVTRIQPVMSMQLTEEWKMIFRPIIPINSFDSIRGWDIITDDPDEGPVIVTDWDRETGLGDIVLWTAFSNYYQPPFVYGFGPTIMLDTASRDELGTGKWSAGPMGLVSYITDKWILGSIVQHWWSFTGDSDRDSVNLTDWQPIIRYRISETTNIGYAPNIQYNWNAPSGDKLRLPLGAGITTVVKLGPLPVSIGVDYYYYAETPDSFGPEQMLRFTFTPVFPSPG